MTKKAFSKNLMLVAGILAAVIILLSQAFQKETSQIISKIKPHKEIKSGKSSDAEKRVVISASTDAVTSGVAAQVEDANPALIREIVFDDKNAATGPGVVRTFVFDFFKTLFRAVISPQAP